MPERYELKILDEWDGVDIKSYRIALILLRFPLFKAGYSLSEESQRDMLKAFEKEVQPLANTIFGEGQVLVKGNKVKFGSLEILLSIVTVGGAVYTFFKDYELLRKGILLFLIDMNKIADRLEKNLSELYSDELRKQLRRRDNENRGTVSH